jgi:acyl carrier protein
MQTQQSETKGKIFGIISRVMSVPLEQVNDDSSPDNIAGWDSLAHMNLVLALEEELGVQFTDTQIVDMLNAELVLLAVEQAREPR